jgi:Tfp pilus assembly protein PilV
MKATYIRRACSGRNGVTLIEIVAALGIIAVGIVGILALFPIAIEAGARAGNRTAAAVLGEYVVEQVRLRADLVKRGNSTAQMLDALNWGDYTYKGKQYTFVDPHDPTYTNGKNLGSGEQIMWQRQQPDNAYDPDDPEKTTNGLGDQEMYSRYEVTLRLTDIDNKPFSNNELRKVIVTVRWPRAFNDNARRKQDTMQFVTFIRPTP